MPPFLANALFLGHNIYGYLKKHPFITSHVLLDLGLYPDFKELLSK